MEKLMMSKAIMQKSDQIKRGGNGIDMSSQNIELQNFESPVAKYNLPSEIMESGQIKSPTSNPKLPTTDAIMSSKLPDAIKKLMIEHPIVPPQMQSGPTLSNELVEKASRLMRENNISNSEPSKNKSTNKSDSFDIKSIKSILKEVVEEVLKENGIISESSEKTNEMFSFKVGKHIFEGKVTKIKKTS